MLLSFILENNESENLQEIVQDVLQSGAICCLVCIENVKHLNAVRIV